MNKEISEKAHLRSDFRKKKIFPWVRLKPTKVSFFGAEIEKFFVRFLVHVKIAKRPFKINWPLGVTVIFSLFSFWILSFLVDYWVICMQTTVLNFMKLHTKMIYLPCLGFLILWEKNSHSTNKWSSNCLFESSHVLGFVP